MFGIVLAIAVLAACGKSEEPPVQPKVTAGEVKKQTMEAASAATQYVQQEKDQFVASAEKEMGALKGKLAELKSSAQVAGGEAKTKLELRIKALDEKLRAAQAKIGEIKDSSGDAWKQLKQGSSNAMADLSRSYDEAVDEYKTDQKK